ncbi:MAG: DUF6054 family protein [Eubacteriales bacterium]|nr:DUF6054 family protein [Eubacteriales bacterium]MDY3333275.1 DUF6054 family protein [Gallibacter sp.]
MAKCEKVFKGNEDVFNHYIDFMQKSILDGSATATLEDSSSLDVGEAKVRIDVFERYSFLGKSRVSLNITTVWSNDNINTIAITSGGSQACFYKINTLGEKNFLTKFNESFDEFIKRFLTEDELINEQ